MDSVLTRAELAAVLDKAVREVTSKATGLSLHKGGEISGGDYCTVHIEFKRGFHSSLSMQADTAMLTRMTQNAIQEEQVTPQDLEDFTKEYFNVICGRIVGLVYQSTKIAARLSSPIFFWGRFEPEGQERQLVLNYFNDHNESVQLIHHVPGPGAKETA